MRLLAPLGVAAPAVRTAVSRMVRQGWLEPVRLADGPGLRADPARRPPARRRGRPHLPHPATPTGTAPGTCWSPTCPAERSRRDRLRAGLTFLGYAQLDDATWIGPRWSEEVDALLEIEGVRAERFAARHDGDSLGLVAPGLGRRGPGPVLHAGGWPTPRRSWRRPATEPDDEQAFAARSRLVHEWRKFLFLDPGLPRELLPRDWPGDQAADFFDAESGRLLPGRRAVRRPAA